MGLGRLARLREVVRSVGGWQTAYEIGLALVVTAAVTIPAAAAEVHPLAPWVTAVTTPVLLLLRLTNAPAAYVAAALVGLCTGGESSLLLAVLSASFAYRTAHWRWLGAGLAVAWICFLGSEWWWASRPDLETVVLLSAFFALVALLPAGVARLVRRQRTLLAAMHGRNEQLHRQQSEIARQAQTRERARIARDLHDSLGHKLTLISLYSGMLRASDEDPGRTAELLGRTSAAAMTELRQILGILRQDDEQPAVRPLTGLDELARDARGSGARVRFTREGQPRPLTALTEHAAYRVIQEGVTNALRHASGGEIVMSLRYEPDALVAAVTNTAGRRVAGPTSGQGLLGLAERVRVASGVLHHGRTPDGGFRLAATLPYPARESPEEPAGTEPGPLPPPAAEADFAHLVDRDRRRSRLILVATTLAIGGLLALCGAGMWLSTTFVTVDRATYDAVRIGQPEAEVRSLLPDQDAGTVGGTGGRPVPDATCVDYQASPLEQLRAEPGQDLIYRLCYRSGRLVDKQAFLNSR
ncbi:sensor histidine kinase [Micromonospora zhanjiangensis]|uniref:histidine kinase n=1 Tax=Micromonospora zhanjiangensis TaxID=1522057 RepID=A0ABV8KR13_9ACTN